MIVGYIRGGSFAHVAAEAAGISARTFREWIARGEGRSARATTEKHKRFAADVKRARAEARLGAEVRVYRDQPTYWLARVARSTAEGEGWSDPAASAKEGSPASYMKRLDKFTSEELREGLRRLLDDGEPAGPHHSPPCPHPRCRCPWHKTQA
jgi:hypothetical protein